MKLSTSRLIILWVTVLLIVMFMRLHSTKKQSASGVESGELYFYGYTIAKWAVGYTSKGFPVG